MYTPPHVSREKLTSEANVYTAENYTLYKATTVIAKLLVTFQKKFVLNLR